MSRFFSDLMGTAMQDADAAAEEYLAKEAMTMKRTIYWESDCGHKGLIATAVEALALLVREARADHDRRFPHCDVVDIERLETAADRSRRLNPQPTREQLGEDFC